MKKQFEEHLGVMLRQSTKLTASEKATMRRAVFAHMEGTTPRGAEPSPYQSFSFFAFHMRAVSSALILVLIMGMGGVSYASEDTLPGDFLYPIKISVNEEVRTMFSTTPEDRAEWGVERAERRLEEAGKLAALGKLSAEIETQIATHFEEHASDVAQTIAMLDTTDIVTAEEITERFEAALSAHEIVLDRIALRTEDVANQQTAKVSETVRAQVSKLAERRLAYAPSAPTSVEGATTMALSVPEAPVMDTLSLKSAAPVIENGGEEIVSSVSLEMNAPAQPGISPDVALRHLTKASSTLEKTKMQLQSAQASLTGSVVEEATNEITALTALLGDATRAMELNDTAITRELSREVTKRAIQLGVYLRAEMYYPKTRSSDDGGKDDDEKYQRIRFVGPPEREEETASKE